MRVVVRFVFCFAVVCLVSGIASAQADSDAILANQNRIAAGNLANGTLTVALELREGRWHAEAEDGPTLFVPAFGEAGKPAQIPGPMLRMPEGTTVHVKVTNKLTTKATVHGLNTRPGYADESGVEVAPDETREFTFLAGAPGTYFYWARTTPPFKFSAAGLSRPMFEDAQLNGAFIVDPVGSVTPDRVFVIDAMFSRADIIHPNFEIVSINGKSYPYTEPLEYTAGETIRWRVINPSFAEHPMHLHGAFFRLLSLGDSQSDTRLTGDDRQLMVTKDLPDGHTMMLEWSPQHIGRWLFHCHFHLHMSSAERVPIFTRAAESAYDPSEHTAPPAAHHPQAMDSMNDMAGLVLTINVKAAATGPPTPAAAVVAPHKIDLVIEHAAADAKSPTFSCSVREGKKIVASEDKSVGPPIVVTRGEPTEITVVNHLNSPTTIHWHGLELDSYYDGVIGGGAGDQVTPAIAPGASFIARFTPNRAGTFIYHTHAADPQQLTGGVYGALIVLEPGQSYDAEHDRLLVIGSRDEHFLTKQITVNGMEEPGPMVLHRGTSYRMRFINMAPNLAANLQLGAPESVVQWRQVAKDGAIVPSLLAKPCDAKLHIASGETYDFEFQPDKPGEIPLQIENILNNARLVQKIVVQ
jgi:FtsP/CotA-like multicopper oxidase with cupredoxin domain